MSIVYSTHPSGYYDHEYHYRIEYLTKLNNVIFKCVGRCTCMDSIHSVYINMYYNCTYYRIVGNFGEVFNLANWQFYGKSPNLKSAIFYSDEI